MPPPVGGYGLTVAQRRRSFPFSPRRPRKGGRNGATGKKDDRAVGGGARGGRPGRGPNLLWVSGSDAATGTATTGSTATGSTASGAAARRRCSTRRRRRRHERRRSGKGAVLVGTEAPDVIQGTVGADSIDGLGENDLLAGDPSLFGPGGNDTVHGGPGDDGVYGRGGDDRVSGGPGNDDTSGTLGADVVSGDEGDDIVDDGPFFEYSVDEISGGPGNDT